MDLEIKKGKTSIDFKLQDSGLIRIDMTHGTDFIPIEINKDDVLKIINQLQKYCSKSKSIYIDSLEFGKHKYYSDGDIVVWGGREPCICKIKRDKNSPFIDYYCSTSSSHNSLSHLYLRPATEKEIELFNELGDGGILPIELKH